MRGRAARSACFTFAVRWQIASQNKGSLLKVISDPEIRGRAVCDVDRLTLAPNRKLPDDVPLHLYTLTPDTSIPDRRGNHRSGTAPERALLHNLLAARYPSLTRIGDQGEEWLRRNAVASWEYWKQSSRMHAESIPETFAFFPVLRKQLGLVSAPALADRYRACTRQEIRSTPSTSCASHWRRPGLAELVPDLVIFDEFQRFQDLLDGSDRGSDIAREMVRTGRWGTSRIAVVRDAVPPLWRGSGQLVWRSRPPQTVLRSGPMAARQ